jgi:hypothetical protein
MEHLASPPSICPSAAPMVVGMKQVILVIFICHSNETAQTVRK